MSGRLPAKMHKDGVTVLCGRTSCSTALGRVTPTQFFLPRLGMVELRDPQGRPHEPPCYAMPYNVRRRIGAAARTGKQIALFRARLRAADPAVTGERFADLSRGKEVWVECPKCKGKDNDITVVGPLPKPGSTGR